MGDTGGQDTMQCPQLPSEPALSTPAWGGICYQPPSPRANLQPSFAEQLHMEAVLGDGWWQMVCVWWRSSATSQAL